MPSKNRRGTTNTNCRGNATDRARRRQYILARFGNGLVANCAHCGLLVDADTLSVDRITPGCEGGTYRRDNIQPSCQPCNSKRGSLLGHARRKAMAK